MAGLLVVALVGTFLAALPNDVQAHGDWVPGLGGTEITVDPDGYYTTNAEQQAAAGKVPKVAGKGFAASEVAEIFECPEGAADLHRECKLLTTATTDSSGAFPATEVELVDAFSTVDKPAAPQVGGTKVPYGVRCHGTSPTNVQCSVVAATFGTDLKPTARAEHLICFMTFNLEANCKPSNHSKETVASTTSSTTTTIPATTTTIPATTTTSVPRPTAAPCMIREAVVDPMGEELRPLDPRPTDPSAAEPDSRSSGDLVWEPRRQAVEPPARQGHAMAYLPPVPPAVPDGVPAPEVGAVDGLDTGRPGQTVMFGGFRAGSTGCVLGDTWIWDGIAWAKALTPSGDPVPGPPARYGHAMAYDGVGIVLFGGYDGLRDLGDTWTWNGTMWARHCKEGLSTDNCDDLGGDVRAPSARARTAMAHHAGDPAKPGDDRAVLFGGSRIVDMTNGQAELQGDTWSWNAATRKWVDHEPPWSPMARFNQHMAYRPGSGVVLQGGSTGGRGDWSRVLHGTFTWDGTTWTIKSGGPGTQSGAMAYRPRTDLVVLRGGAHASSGPRDGFWDGRAWAQPDQFGISSIAGLPPERDYPSMAEDALGNLVLFGGYGRRDAPSNAQERSSNNDPVQPPVEECPNDAEQRLQQPPPDPNNPGGTVNDLTLFPLGPGPCGSYPFRYGNDVGSDVVLGEWTERSDTYTLVTPGSATAPNTQERVTVEVDPLEIAADGKSTARVTVTATWGGKPEQGYEIALSTNGDVTFADYQGVTDVKGEYTTLITASKTPGPETITATYERPPHLRRLEYPTTHVPNVIGNIPYAGMIVYNELSFLQPPRPVSTLLFEKGMTLTLDPVAIPADGAATSVATAKVYKAGVTDEKVCFKTDGDVSFSGTDDCATKTAPNTWTITIIASKTPQIELITATGTVSELSATADLFEGLGGWINRTAEGPNPGPGRENAAMAYDEVNKVTVLFGGYYGDHHRTSDTKFSSTGDYFGYCPCPATPAELVGDTWTWDGSHWSQVTFAEGQSQPTPREGAAMAYDPSSGGLVLFGGHDGSDNLADTWTYDAKAKTWTKRHVAGPSKRYVANMASDGTGVVLFAGTAGQAYDMHGPAEAHGPGRLDDTWIWRNGAWTDVTPKPSPPPPAPPLRRATFSNNEPIVVPLPPPPPGCPDPLGCPPDTANPYPSSIPVSGLSGRVADVNVTLHGLSWTEHGLADADILVVAPGGQSAIVMSDACGEGEDGAANPNYHPIARDKAITLSFDDGAGAELAADGPCTSGTYRPTNPKRVDASECTPKHDADAFPGPARDSGGRSLAALNGGVQANGTWSLYVVDDCPGPIEPRGDAGRIDGGWSIDIATSDAAVTPPKPLLSPPGRGRAAMAYHPPTGKVVMYGGSSEYMYNFFGTRGFGTTNGVPFRPLGDTWTWDPKAMAWAQEGTGTHPGERRSAAMAHHPRTGQLVLFGGAGMEGRVADDDAYPECPYDFYHPKFGCPTVDNWLNDTWTWNGAAWSRQATPSRPPGQHLAGMAPDADGGLVLVGGLGPNSTRIPCPPDRPSDFCSPIPKRSGPTTWTWDSNVSLGLSAQAVPADGTSTSVATARVVDAEGKGVAGLKVSFTTDGDVGFSTVTDHGDGTYSATVTASLSGEIETLSVRTPFGPASATLYEVAAASGPCDVAGLPGTWNPVRDMPDPARIYLGGAAATGGDGRIYIFGGLTHWDERGDAGAALSTVQAYDPCTNTWQTLPPMPGGARSVAAASGPDGRIYLVGGKYEGQLASDLVEVYTPGTGSTPGRWQTLAPLPMTKAYTSVAVDQNGDVYATGGEYYSEGEKRAPGTAHVYSPTTGGWSPLPNMKQARTKHGAAVGPDGRIFALGSHDGQSVEAHTPSGDWTEVSPMSVPHFTVGASTGTDALIYAVGGDLEGSTGGLTKSAAVEAYAACVDAWIDVAPMSFKRHKHAVVTGPDGRIYALGGNTRPAGDDSPEDEVFNSPEPSRSVEAYTPNPLASPCPKVSVQGSEVQESRSTPTRAKFTISIDRPVNDRVVVGYRTKDRTAQAGSDYEATLGSVVFEPLDIAPKEVYVTVNADAVAERTEKFTLELFQATQPALVSFANNPGIGSILDAGAEGDPEPARPELRISGDTVDESFVSNMTGHFTVTMSKALSEPVTFDYATSDGTAKAGSDYTATRDNKTIPAGETSVNIPVTVLPDEIEEQPERFSMKISNPTGASVAVPEAEAIILDAVEGLRIDDKQVWEGNSQVVPAPFTVSLGRPLDHLVSVEFATSDDSARAWDDYNPIQGTVHFAPGEYQKVVPVGVLGDHVPEPTEYYSVKLSKPVGEKIGSGDGTGTILDDDKPLPAIEPQPAPPGLAVVAPPPPPPPAPIAQAQPQAQSQAQQQLQQQSQQQAQSQGQSQAQQQAQSQGQSQAQSQGQAQAQAQAQAQVQGGLTEERQRERQAERAYLPGSGGASGAEHLATGVRQSSPVGAAALWGGLVVVGLAIAFSQQTKIPTPARQRSRGNPVGTQGSTRLPTERIRGRRRRA